jgi:hypothetical protein
MDEDRAEITLTIHGLKAMDERVLASVFATKLLNLINGLKQADKEASGETFHEYTIEDLSIGSAAVKITEYPSKSDALSKRSPINVYYECAQSIYRNDFSSLKNHVDLIGKIEKLCTKVGKNFQHAEIKIDDDNVIRVDEFLANQAKNARIFLEKEEDDMIYFFGVSGTSFDGTIKAVDLRCDVPQVKLILSAGGKEIDCVVKNMDIDTIRESLDRRAWVEGQGIYNGKSGLPSRFEIEKIEPIKPIEDVNIHRWRGSFSDFSVSEWETDG